VVTTPFDIVYYGNTFTQMGVCSNGFVALGNNTYNSWGNGDMGGGDGTGNMISAFWEDLNPNNGGNIRVYDDAANDRFVVSWIGIPHYSGGGPESFQIVFYNQDSYPTTSGNTPFHIQYLVVDTPGVATVGHQNGAMNVGNQYMRDTVLRRERRGPGQRPEPVGDHRRRGGAPAHPVTTWIVYEPSSPLTCPGRARARHSTTSTRTRCPLGRLHRAGRQHHGHHTAGADGAQPVLPGARRQRGGARQAPAARREVQVLQTVETRK
jgi:hypothetical protein